MFQNRNHTKAAVTSVVAIRTKALKSAQLEKTALLVRYTNEPGILQERV